jgi:hypothetical protein
LLLQFDLFLWLRLKRAAGGDIYYVVPTGREHEPDWKKWNPHGSWDKDGNAHHIRASTKKCFLYRRGNNPTPKFKGTHQLIARGRVIVS